jgi:hypothetical protein
MANYYSTPIDGCFNCPMQHDGDCKQPYVDRPALEDVRAAVAARLPPPRGCVFRDLPLYLHGRFADAHPDGTEPRDREAEDAVITLLYGDHGADFRLLNIQPRNQPADTIKRLGDAVVTLTAAVKVLEAKLLDRGADEDNTR